MTALAIAPFRSQWERLLGQTESPIEALFLESFCVQAIEWGYGVGKCVRAPNETIVVEPQKWFDRYRADFLISFSFFGHDLCLVVECDGHEFHERTKEQARRDKQRDRDLQKLGCEVFRFTGSELRGNAKKCAYEALDAIMSFQTGVIQRAMEAA